MTKKLLIAGGVLVVILLVAVKFLGSNLDAIVKKAITRVGPEMTGVSVDVDKVGISLADGRGEIGGLVIGNPRGTKGRTPSSSVQLCSPWTRPRTPRTSS